ncbi:MAG TPA: anti-sigma factor antagonist [Clostridia bacterium]|nr:anti-sigma factor antagonist [Clostridia bacterium]
MLKIECKAVSSKNALIIKLSGELDMHTIETVRQYIDKFLDKKVGKLFFDLRDIAFIDSSGIGLILGRYKKIQQLGGSLAIICNKPQIKKILEMSGITQIVKIYEDFKPEEEGI